MYTTSSNLKTLNSNGNLSFFSCLALGFCKYWPLAWEEEGGPSSPLDQIFQLIFQFRRVLHSMPFQIPSPTPISLPLVLPQSQRPSCNPVCWHIIALTLLNCDCALIVHLSFLFTRVNYWRTRSGLIGFCFYISSAY